MGRNLKAFIKLHYSLTRGVVPENQRQQTENLRDQVRAMSKTSREKDQQIAKQKEELQNAR